MSTTSPSYSHINRELLSEDEKKSGDFQWFKEKLNSMDRLGFYNYQNAPMFSDHSQFKRKKINYDLCNGIADFTDLEYVFKPFGENVGELPATMANRDIISPMIKALEGIEMDRPFDWKAFAINEEATTRKEEERFGRVKQWVEAVTMGPIRQRVQQQALQELRGRELTNEEQQQIQNRIEQQVQALKPDKIRKYMAREHQDPVEMMAQQLLEMAIQDNRIQHKFNKGWKHALRSGDEVYWVGGINGKVEPIVVNSLYFDYDRTDDLDFVEDTDWAHSEMYLPPSQLVRLFEFEDQELQDIYASVGSATSITDSDFTFQDDSYTQGNLVRVLHGNWKSMYKIGYLLYEDQQGKPQMMIVNEDYKLNKDNGDLHIEWEWIARAYEGYKICINDGLFKNMQLVPNQYFDEENPHICKLSYIGGSYDSLNSDTTSPVDRVKSYQYMYNIIMYRLELLMASDKGKMVFFNINAIPKSAKMDMQKWLYYAEALKIGWVNPNEEGNRGLDVTQMVKEVDMSLASDINRYVELAEYMERKAGEVIGVTENMLGNIQKGEAVRNVRQNIAQSTHVLEPYFQFHNTIKQNVLQATVDQQIKYYSEMPPQKLSYVLDDLSLATLTTDPELLTLAKVGIYVGNSAKAAQAREEIKQLGHAAMQNQMIDFSDVIKVLRAESIISAEEELELAQEKKAMELRQSEQAKIEAESQRDAREHNQDMEKLKYERDTKLLIEKEKGKVALQKQAMLSVGFNEDKDVDDDGQLDVMEIYKAGIDAKLAARKQALDEMAFAVDTRQGDRELDIKEMAAKKKPASSGA